MEHTLSHNSLFVALKIDPRALHLGKGPYHRATALTQK